MGGGRLKMRDLMQVQRMVGICPRLDRRQWYVCRNTNHTVQLPSLYACRFRYGGLIRLQLGYTEYREYYYRFWHAVVELDPWW